MDLRVSEPEEMSRDELIALAWRQDGQITTLSTQVADLLEANGQIAALIAMNEELAAKVAKLEHLLSRNSGNSSMHRPRTTSRARHPRR